MSGMPQDRQALGRVQEDLAQAGEGSLFDGLLEHARNTPKDWARWPLSRQVWFLRVSNELTQAELARRAGIAQSHVAQVEQGRDVRLSTLRKLFVAMGCDLLVLPHPQGEPFGDQPRPRHRPE